MIGLDTGLHSLGIALQVFLLDLLLSGDNAIVIAMASRRLPAQKIRQAIALGTIAAIALRVVFTSMVTLLLNVPCLKLLGMFALIVIAIKLLIDEESDTHDEHALPLAGKAQPSDSLWSTIGVIVVADVAMSLDNVVALAAIAQNNLVFLILGLALSVPLLMYGSLLVTNLLNRYPILIPAGGALLGWVAGDIGMSDPLIADWVTTQAPGLTVGMPIVCALFVLFESKIIRQNRPRYPAPVPRALPRLRALPSVQRVENRAELSATTPVVTPMVQVTKAPVARLAGTESAANDAQASAAPSDDASANTETQDDSQPGIVTRKRLLYAVLSILALPLLATIGSVAYNMIINKGIMPTPSQLAKYECPGFNGSILFYYRHGKDDVQIRSNSGKLDGVIHYGKIDWYKYSGDATLLGFTPPDEIINDDAKSIRISGGSFKEIDCVLTNPNAANPK